MPMFAPLDELCEISNNSSWFEGLTSRGRCVWRGASKIDFMAFPPTVQREMGYALFLAQMGERHSTMARTLGGFGGATVIEVKESHDGNAYRAVYTVRYADAVYVLHAFQKKSKQGIVTPKAEIDLIEKRLKDLLKEKEGPK
jgi:phage-related protein